LNEFRDEKQKEFANALIFSKLSNYLILN
jgi:hypothetical protein